MQTVAITGGNGFVGSRLVQRLARRPEIETRALVRSSKRPQIAASDRMTIVDGDLADPAVLERLLRPGCSVVNLAYDPDAPAQINLAAAEALAQACTKFKVRRLVHCSTAVVVGKTRLERIDETTACHPQSAYEQTKLAVENLLLEKARGNFELAILRPTAVFGAGGRNLVKLARDLTHGPRWANYLRSCANGHRRMNLVEVDNAAAAAEFLLGAENRVDREIFIISDDEDPQNNFHDVERHLMQAFGIADYPLPRITVPKTVLSLLLRARGRSLSNPDTVFASNKLSERGFSKPTQFAAGVAAFARWYHTAHG
jgi:nucleoside-diphosphate-sugar epimerase